MYFNGKQIFLGAFIRDWESMSPRTCALGILKACRIHRLVCGLVDTFPHCL
jgi:hypothetical protein